MRFQVSLPVIDTSINNEYLQRNPSVSRAVGTKPGVIRQEMQGSPSIFDIQIVLSCLMTSDLHLLPHPSLHFSTGQQADEDEKIRTS